MVELPSSEPLFLPSPNTLGLPLLDRGQQAGSETRELVEEKWPSIESVVRAGHVADAIAEMKGLAKAMRERTRRDPEPWRETLTLSRRILYEDMMSIARWGGNVEVAEDALEECREWDEEVREHIEGLLHGE